MNHDSSVLAETTFTWSGGSATRLMITEELRVPAHGHEGAHLCIVTAGTFDERWRGMARCERGGVRVSPSHDFHEIEILEAPFECIVIGWDASKPGLSGERVYGHNEILLRQAQRLGCAMMSADPLARLSSRGLAAELAAQGERFGARRDPGDVPSWLHEVRDTMDREANRPPSLRRLARAAGVHPVHVSRAFRAHFGQTLREYVRERRLACAVAALLSSPDTISVIAAESGFADHAHLTRTMHQCLGQTPSALRARSVATLD